MSRIIHFRLTPRGIVLFLFFATLPLAPSLFADDSIEGMKKFGNRVEGTTVELHGDQDMTLLGIHRKFGSFLKNTNLMVQFFLPNMGSFSAKRVFLEAREITDTTHYFMQSTQADWQGGFWNTFSPWPTKDIIDPLGIKADNIGVVAGYTDDKGPIYMPVDVSSNTSQPTQSLYSLYFETSFDLHSLGGSIVDSSGHTIKNLEKEECTVSPNCVLFPAASSHVITIDMTRRDDGVYTIHLIGYRPRSSPVHMEVRIYHRLK